MKHNLKFKIFLSFSILLISGFIPFSESQALTVNPRLELSGDPGSTISTVIKIINEERQSCTFYLRTENFNAADESGSPSFNLRREGLSTWIVTPLSITLGPGETINLPVEINIPYDADPGGHYSAIFFLTEPPQVEDESGAIGISSKLGSLILLRVNGDFVQDADILEFGTKDKQKFFTNIPIQFYYRFQNTGEDHLKPIGDIQIKNLIGQTVKILPANTLDGSVLPSSVRKFTSVWRDKHGSLKQEAVVDLVKSEALSFISAVNFQARNFAIGRYSADLKLAFGTQELKSDSKNFVFYIFPWQLLSVVIPAIIIAIIIIRWLVKRYNRYIIKKAQRNMLN